MARALWLTIGLLATGLGIAGAVLPLLPATPFLLIAAYAFARSSPRLHAWLLAHRLMGPLIDDWRRHGAIDRKAKILALLVMGVTLLLSLVSGVAPLILGVQALLMGGAATFILTRPGRPERRAGRE